MTITQQIQWRLSAEIIKCDILIVDVNLGAFPK